MYKYIKVEKEGFKCNVTLTRSEKRNAFTPTMVNEIDYAFRQINDDGDIKVVIIRAEGPVFCAGMDLKTFEDPTLDVINPHIVNKNISLGEVFDSLLKPSVAILEGNVIAGGFLIILGCTYVFGSREIKFRLPELELGIFPFQVMASLLKVMSEKQVLQLCLDTGYFGTERALDLGIIDGFLEDGKAEEVINSFAEKDEKALKTGIYAMRRLDSIAPDERFSFLKNVLDELKRSR
ncbi:Enoyl-CoA hydratase/carnithine racemase [Sphingobacterium nematocida]|uniref:Enoyl-CoA hydratase/carnithine racemase n=1 Tax=Sphingobacterium nematocida TaxID=1513896 RepID=A0A1T5DHQ2_9SPHI|nr:enoyl-CoA hydratase/isomerase family protein [Sphingobacterium nematocida]SKB71219.1 Enoyl-CoA hydratase/carnithine racemase [Sphingobacterium nematocida]